MCEHSPGGGGEAKEGRHVPGEQLAQSGNGSLKNAKETEPLKMAQGRRSTGRNRKVKMERLVCPFATCTNPLKHPHPRRTHVVTHFEDVHGLVRRHRQHGGNVKAQVIAQNKFIDPWLVNNGINPTGAIFEDSTKQDGSDNEKADVVEGTEADAAEPDPEDGDVEANGDDDGEEDLQWPTTMTWSGYGMSDKEPAEAVGKGLANFGTENILQGKRVRRPARHG